MTDKMTDARAEIASAEAALRRARERLIELEREEAYPPEPSSDVIVFSLAHKYAAIRIGKYWYTTGQTLQAHGVTWEELVDWMRKNHVSSYLNIYPMRRAEGNPTVVEK